MSLHLEIVTPKGSVLSAEIDEAVLPGKLGEFGILEGHIPFLSSLKPGVLRYRKENSWQRLAVGNGFAEVGANHKVLVLTDCHALPQNIDLPETKKELSSLEAQLKTFTGELGTQYQELLEKQAWVQACIDAKAES